MSDRAIILILGAIGFGSLLLLFDSVVTSVATDGLQMTAMRIAQAQVIYLFGAVGAALGLLLVGFLSLGRLGATQAANERQGRR
jgi:hypothetical protein